MDDIEFLALAARVARRAGKPASTVDLADAQTLAQEATSRQRRALAIGRPALMFKLVSVGLPSLTKAGHLKAMEMSFDIGVAGGVVRRLTTRLPGANLAWLAVASRDGAGIDLLGDPVRYADNTVRNAVRGTFLSRVSRLCPALADVLGAHLRVIGGIGGRVVFEPDERTPEIVVR